MLKHLSLCGTLFVLMAGAATAQQRDAVLQKIDVPGVAFDLIVATPKPDGVTYDLSESPDALLVHLAGGKLALGFERADTMLKALETVQGAGCAFVDSKSHTPVAVYVAPKAE